jgi:uncharacterized protein YqgV (UPF0045/DUF77 family)
MEHIVNLAIQVLPLGKEQKEAYVIIDAAIASIAASGLKYVVCPFETVVEGPYERVMQLVDEIQDVCYKAGAESLLVNMKLHRSKENDMHIDDKIGKYTG